MRSYNVWGKVTIEYEFNVDANSWDEAKEQIREEFYKEYNYYPDDGEITFHSNNEEDDDEDYEDEGYTVDEEDEPYDEYW